MSSPVFDFPTRLTTKPLAVEFFGSSRLASNLAALGLARRVNPHFLWLEVRGTSGLDEVDGGLVPSLIPAGQLFVSERAEELRPDPGIANMALWSMISSEETPEVVARLRDFLLLPQPLQQLIVSIERTDRPGVVVVSNSDRIPGFCPADPAEAGAFLDAFRRESVSLICTTRSDEPSPAPFDQMFRVVSAPETGWEEGHLHDVLRPGDTPAFPAPVALRDIPSIQEVAAAFSFPHPSWV